jgi:hypothetical protein
MDAHHARREDNKEEMMAKLDASVNAWRVETTACQEATETYPEMMEANPEDIESEAEHEKVLKEEAGVKSVGALKNRIGAGIQLQGTTGNRRNGSRVMVGPGRNSQPPPEE